MAEFSAADAKSRIDELCDRLNYYSYRYYVDNESDVSDYEYDMLQRELKSLEEQYPEYLRPDSPTQRVGGEAQSVFIPVTHEVRMESLQDAFDFAEIDDFDRRVGEAVSDYSYVVEPKIDGLSVSLEYENGLFVRGSTRGDGDTGEDHGTRLAPVGLILGQRYAVDPGGLREFFLCPAQLLTGAADAVTQSLVHKATPPL